MQVTYSKSTYFQTTLIGLIALLLGGAFLLVFNSGYVFDKYMQADDLVQLPKLFRGERFNISGKIIFEKIISWVGSGRNIETLRAFLTVMLATIAATSSMIFYRYSREPISAVLLGILLVCIPYSYDQTLFVLASHPLVATFFGMLGLFCGYAFLQSQTWQKYIWFVLCLLFFQIASYCSPNALLLYLSPLGFVIAGALKNGLKKTLGVAALFIVTVIATLATKSMEYHYSGTKMLTFSFEKVFENIGKYLELTFNFGLKTPISSLELGLLIAFWLGVSAFLIGIVIAAFKIKKFKALIYLLIPPLVTSALFFGPASVTTRFVQRYSFGSSIFLFFALALLMSYVLFNSPRKYHRSVSVLAIILISFSVYFMNAIKEQNLAPYRTVNQYVETWVKAEQPKWDKNSQIILLIPTSLAAPSSGFAHWSTGWIHYLMGRTDVDAIIGYERQIEYPLYGDAFPAPGQRKKFTGFKPGFPLFLYRMNDDGTYQSITYAAHISPEGKVFVSKFGDRIKPLDPHSPDPDLCSAGHENITVWPYPGVEGQNLFSGSPMNLLGSEDLLSRGEYTSEAGSFNLKFKMNKKSGSQESSHDIILGENFRIKNINNKIYLYSKPFGSFSFQHNVPATRPDISVTFAGIDGCISGMWLNHNFVGPAFGEAFEGVEFLKPSGTENWKVDLYTTPPPNQLK